MNSSFGLHMHMRRVTAQTAIIEFQGELDISTSPRAREMMLGLLGDGCQQIIINLHKTDYIDSTGLGALVGTLRRAREQGGGLRLVGLSNRVRKLFEITRLNLAFPIDASEEDALAQLALDTGVSAR